MGLKSKDQTIEEVFNHISYEVDFCQREYRLTDEETGQYKPIESLMEDLFYKVRP